MIGEESEFVSELDKLLNLQEQQKARKTKALHAEWESEVFDKVQGQVNAAVDKRTYREVSNRQAALMQEFIDVSNSKARTRHRPQTLGRRPPATPSHPRHGHLIPVASHGI